VLDGLAAAAIVVAIIAILRRRIRQAPVQPQQQSTAGKR
jgi:CO/xanthine dehydrogenase Mo-binding subunit